MNYQTITTEDFDKKVDVINTDIYLLTIYDKGEKESISKREIKHLKAINGLV
jgi:hypothetical protein